IKLFTQFVSRNAMNIDGLSEMTLEKFVDCGFIKEFADIYKLDRYKERIVRMEGFGEKSYENLIASIDKSRNTTLSRVLFGLGIAGVGSANAKLICRAFKDDLDGLRAAKPDELTAIDGVGDVMSNAICEYFADDVKSACLDRLIAEVTIDKASAETADNETSGGLEGLSFVVTGSLEHFKSRNDLKDLIEARGGKVTGSVTGKTECLINNDFASQSSKNKTAKSLGVAILSEDDFLAKYMPDYKY
ncbi:MAG: NAD-dependent DNA ligase LigA, partial [Lachnospiraceae bacterium]|nr:NAD-dependent DNA ligase LigA [Lachnospiraceae bacterium]